MKTGTIVLVGAGAFLLWKFGGLARFANTMQIVFRNINITGLSSVDIVLGIQNVSNSTIQVNSMAGTVFLNGNSLGDFSKFDQITVPPNSETPLTVKFNLGLLGLPSLIKDIINNPGQTYNIQINGNANVNGLPVPINDTEQVTI